MNEDFARAEICRIGKSLFDRGYVHGTAGNISVRLDDAFLITPTDACLGFLREGDLAKVGPDGALLAGPAPSKTLALHRRIYDAHPPADVPRCIVHTHSAHCVALSMTASGRELLPAVTPYFVMKVGHVPLVPYRRPGDPRTADDVAALVASWREAGTPIRAVMLARLGPNVWHDSPAQAMAVLEELEETARLMVLCDPAPAPLPGTAIDELRQAFNARW